MTKCEYTISLIHCLLIQGCVYPRAANVYKRGNHILCDHIIMASCYIQHCITYSISVMWNVQHLY